MNKLFQLQTLFLKEQLNNKGHSKATVNCYERYTRFFFKFLFALNIKSLEEITEDVIDKYRDFLFEKELAPITKNYHLRILRIFYYWLECKRIETPITYRNIELARVPYKKLDIIPKEKFIEIIQSLGTEDIRSIRLKALLLTMFSTGLRISELVALNREDVNMFTGQISVVGKGKKVRVVFLVEEAKLALASYLATRKDEDIALFVTSGLNNGNIRRLSVRIIQFQFADLKKNHGVSCKFTPHSMRHLMATELITNGADLFSVQEILGHSSIMTTQRYLHTTNTKLKKVHESHLSVA